MIKCSIHGHVTKFIGKAEQRYPTEHARTEEYNEEDDANDGLESQQYYFRRAGVLSILVLVLAWSCHGGVASSSPLSGRSAAHGL